MWMLALFVGYFLYESDASNWWWTGYWTIVGLEVVKEIVKSKARKAKEIEEQLRYWEGK